MERACGFSNAPYCLDALKSPSWPGNVRELHHAIERAVIVSRSPMLSVGDLPNELSSQLGLTRASRFGLAALWRRSKTS
ncbi:hypothetical protein [Candidatus Binatus sp.]|jgi:DNA-binding NtrC family response regulator|uniref:hypothetical protein n=1 Tax=Candidatus Binatus sp. TaxID=2811406 RepID=UPI003C705F91